MMKLSREPQTSQKAWLAAGGFGFVLNCETLWGPLKAQDTDQTSNTNAHRTSPKVQIDVLYALQTIRSSANPWKMGKLVKNERIRQPQKRMALEDMFSMIWSENESQFALSTSII